MAKYIAYIRVSTQKQGDSGLGMEAQRASILSQIGDGELVQEYIDVCTGKKSRPNLWAAIDQCKKVGAVLVVAKLDRLARNMKLACQLMESGVRILVCGMPEMTTLVFHILCAVAEEEARLISQRTKDALTAAKARGVKLGNSRPRSDGMTIGVTAGNKTAVVDQRLVAQVSQLRNLGLGYQEIADRINDQGYRAPKGGLYSKSQIYRLVG